MIDFSTASYSQIKTLFVVLRAFKSRIDDDETPDDYHDREFVKEINRLYVAVENALFDRLSI